MASDIYPLFPRGRGDIEVRRQHEAVGELAEAELLGNALLVSACNNDRTWTKLIPYRPKNKVGPP